jgi:hypothetical protein
MSATVTTPLIMLRAESRTRPQRPRTLGQRTGALISSAVAAVLGVLPHVLHHVGPLAGAALLAGTFSRMPLLLTPRQQPQRGTLLLAQSSNAAKVTIDQLKRIGPLKPLEQIVAPLLVIADLPAAVGSAARRYRSPWQSSIMTRQTRSRTSCSPTATFFTELR